MKHSENTDFRTSGLVSQSSSSRRLDLTESRFQYKSARSRGQVSKRSSQLSLAATKTNHGTECPNATVAALDSSSYRRTAEHKHPEPKLNGSKNTEHLSSDKTSASARYQGQSRGKSEESKHQRITNQNLQIDKLVKSPHHVTQRTMSEKRHYGHLDDASDPHSFAPSLSSAQDRNASSLTKDQVLAVKQSNSDVADPSVLSHNSPPQVPERLFMSTLVKHTAIALAIIVPLAAVTAYAATPSFPTKANTNSTANTADSNSPISTTTQEDHRIQTGSAFEPDQKSVGTRSATTPISVDKVDLSRYAGTWYEIGRLPMYFQRKCAGDVTATYTPQEKGQKITVLNQCTTSSGEQITASGEAMPVDASGSQLKVTFLPSWLRWAPFGKADYWVLALDESYQSALVGTPNKKYLWLLSRTPQMSEKTYQKYRQIAQAQGYDLADFALTPQTKR